MKSFILAAAALLATPASVALAQTAPASDAMAKDDHMMAAGDAAMSAMSKADKAKLARCKKMSPAKAAKNPACVKLMAMHSDGKM